MNYYVGVDVGTGSVRAALVSANGKIIKTSTCPIKTYNPQPEYYEQSSDNIWKAVCQVVRNVVNKTLKQNIKGIGFDATCSLVALDENGLPVTISPTENENQNVILWMDHRAEMQATFINSTKHEVLKYVGGKISLEMETPKMLWLKQNLPKSWKRAKLLFDLPDFLTWKATGCETRSLCSLVCKWNYCANSEGKNGWNIDFFEKIGLADLQENNWKKIGQDVRAPGEPVDFGISEEAANKLGVSAGTVVATSIIDAHAGGLGMLSCFAPGIPKDITKKLGLICGTSTCHMIVSEKEVFVNGVWGPYYSAMIAGMWLNEGGQSTTGKLLDHVIETHPATTQIRHKLDPIVHIQEYLTKLLEQIRKQRNYPHISYLTQNFHVWPDFHGNRSPLADPTLRGMISGLSLAVDEEHLAIQYLATMQALTYGTKHILEALKSAGHTIEAILICGGLSQNPLFIQTQADVLGLPVVIPEERESVLLGSAILGAFATGEFLSIHRAIEAMAGSAKVVKPHPESYEYHCRKYRVFQKMVKDQIEYRNIMELNV